MKKITCLLCFGSIAITGGLLAHNHDGPEVEIVATEVTAGIYMITGQGGNIGLAVDEQYTLMIDDQFANLSDAIKAEIASISDKPIAYLFNTHFHFDHTGGNEAFSDSVGVIVAHENVRQRLKDGATIAAFGKEMPPAAAEDLPALSFSDELTIYQSGKPVVLKHFANAHTDGDAVAYFPEANVLHAGDLYFSGFYPFIDTSNGGDVHGYIAAMAGMIKMIDVETKIIPGHGPLSGKADLERDLNVLSEIVAAVESGIDQSLEVDAIIELPIIQRHAKTHGGGFLDTKTFISILYDGLK